MPTHRPEEQEMAKRMCKQCKSVEVVPGMMYCGDCVSVLIAQDKAVLVDVMCPDDDYDQEDYADHSGR